MRGSGRIDGSVRNLLFVGGRQTRLRTVPVHGLFHVFSSFSTPPTSSDFQRFSRFPFFRAVLLTHALFKRETKLSKLVLLLSSFERPWVRTRCGGTHPNENRRRPSGTRPFEVPPVSEGDRTTKTLPPGARGPRRGTRLLSYSRRPTCACGRLVTLADAENDLGGATLFRPFWARAMSGGSGGFDSHEVHY